MEKLPILISFVALLYVSHSLDLPFCDKQSCLDLGGVCLNSSNNGCACLGVVDCAFPITDCSCSVAGNPCYYGECMDDEIQGYACNCIHGWSGKHCEIDQDFCIENESYCIHGNCTEGVGSSIHCNCLETYRGETCDELFCPGDYCSNGGTCNVVNDSLITCSCKLGYYGDQCENEVPRCTEAACIDASGVCVTDDNGDCACFGVLNCTTPISHCAEAHPYLACLHGGKCINGTNSISCECLPGLQGNHCQMDIDFCAFAECVNGECKDELGYAHHCECNETYKGDTCAECYCPEGYCMNSGTCSIVNSTSCILNCDCLAGFSGLHCEDDPDICSDNKECSYNGECIEGYHFNYTCKCNEGFTGEYCSEELDPCSTNPCMNNGTCNENATNTSQCTCQEGLGGTYCEVDEVDACSSNTTCLNGGTCIDGPGATYECLCLNGYSGLNCETDMNYCGYLTNRTSVCSGCTDSIGDLVICDSCSQICSCNVCNCRPVYCHDDLENVEETENISCVYPLRTLGLSVIISCSCGDKGSITSSNIGSTASIISVSSTMSNISQRNSHVTSSTSTTTNATDTPDVMISHTEDISPHPTGISNNPNPSPNPLVQYRDAVLGVVVVLLITLFIVVSFLLGYKFIIKPYERQQLGYRRADDETPTKGDTPAKGDTLAERTTAKERTRDMNIEMMSTMLY